MSSISSSASSKSIILNARTCLVWLSILHRMSQWKSHSGNNTIRVANYTQSYEWSYNIMYMYIHVQWTSHCRHPWNIWTLFCVQIVVILYKTTPDVRTPLQSGQVYASQWCPQYRGSTVHKYQTVHVRVLWHDWIRPERVLSLYYSMDYSYMHTSIWSILHCEYSQWVRKHKINYITCLRPVNG